MAVESLEVPVGPPLWEAIEAYRAEAQALDPLQPVTVLAPSSAAAVVLRRWLGETARGGRGVVGVQCTTVEDALATLALQLGVEPAPPASPLHVASALRAVLAADPQTAAELGEGPAPRPGTLRGLTALAAEVQALPADERRALAERAAASKDLGPAVRCVLAALARLDEVLGPGPGGQADRALAAAVRAAPAVVAEALGPVLVVEPSRGALARAGVLRAVADVVPVRVLVGITGDGASDRAARDAAAQLAAGGTPRAGRGLRPPLEAPPGRPGPGERRAGQVLRRLRLPAVDSEIEAALRFLASAWKRGVPLERLALLHPGQGLVARAAERAVAAAGVPHHRPGGGRLADRVAGRLLLGAVALDKAGWKPEDVLGLLASGPVRDPVRGGAVPVAAWSTAVVAAGCRGDPGIWQARLEALGGALEGQRHEALGSGEGEPGLGEHAGGGRVGESGPWGPETVARSLGAVAGDRAEAIRVVRDVRAFVDWLAAWVAGEPEGSWRAWSRWCREVLQRLVGDGGAVETWPSEEREARESVLAVLDELGELDRIEPGPAPAVVRTALADALAAPAPSTTRAGRGLLVAPLSAAAGLPLAAVAVVGLTDGVVPGSVQPDGLLAVASKEALGSLGERAQWRRDAQRRALAWVVRSCADVLLTTSRSDPGGGAAEPSAWWEQPPGVPDPGEAVEVPSHPVLVAELGPTLDVNDARQRSLVLWRLGGRSLATHPLVPAGSEHGRRGALEVIPADALPEGWPHRPLAPSALDRFCECPHRYFLGRVLGLEAMPVPVGPEGLDGQWRGRLVHRVLQEVGEWMRGQDEEPTDDELEERVRAAVDREGLEAAGWLGTGGLLWELDLHDLADQLVEAVRADARRRDREQVRVVAVEQALGGPGGVAIPLPGGRQLVLRGRADRIDRLADGRLWVEDYKTGQTDRFKKLGPGALARAGGVQLCAYLMATEVTTGEAVAGGAYQFVVGDDPGRRLPLTWDEEAREEGKEVLRALAEALASGAFPQRRGADRGDGQGQCPRCPVAAACPPDRRDAWEEAGSLSGFRRLVALLEGTEPSDVEEDETL